MNICLESNSKQNRKKIYYITFDNWFHYFLQSYEVISLFMWKKNSKVPARTVHRLTVGLVVVVFLLRAGHVLEPNHLLLQNFELMLTLRPLSDLEHDLEGGSLAHRWGSGRGGGEGEGGGGNLRRGWRCCCCNRDWRCRISRWRFKNLVCMLTCSRWEIWLFNKVTSAFKSASSLFKIWSFASKRKK